LKAGGKTKRKSAAGRQVPQKAHWPEGLQKKRKSKGIWVLKKFRLQKVHRKKKTYRTQACRPKEEMKKKG